jgi:hypothetical protein
MGAGAFCHTSQHVNITFGHIIDLLSKSGHVTGMLFGFCFLNPLYLLTLIYICEPKKQIVTAQQQQ